jgi:hypothetical protein
MATKTKTKKPLTKVQARKPAPFVGDGGKKTHPLVHLVKMMPTGEIAKLLGHKNHTTVSIYANKARKFPTTTIPAEWVLPLCGVLKTRPHELRPDLYRPEWEI